MKAKNIEQGNAVRLKELEALNDLARDINSSLSINQVISSAYKHILALFTPDLAVIYLVDRNTLISQGEIPENPTFKQGSPAIKQVGQCLCGLVAQDHAPLYSMNIHTDQRCVLPECKLAGIHSFAALPLKVGMDIQGVLGIGSFKERDFSEQSAFLEALSNQIAVAVRNAALHEKLEDYSEKLNQSLQDLVRSEEENKRAHKDWGDIFQAIGHSVFILDMKHTILMANPAAQRLTGMSEDDLRGKKCHEIIHGTNIPAACCPLETMIQTGNLETYAMQMEIIGGGIFLVSCTPVLDENGNVEKVIHISTDITEQKRAEEALRESERKLTDVINFLPDATFVIDRQRRVVVWNQAMEELTGVKARDMLGRADHEYSLPFYGEKRPLLIDLLSDDPRVVERYYPGYTKQGDSIIAEAFVPALTDGGAYVWGIAKPLYDSSGNMTGAIESLRITTERKAAEKLIRSQKEELEAVNKEMALTVQRLVKANQEYELANIRLSGAQKDLITAHEEMRQSEEKYSTAFRLSPAVFTLSTLADGRYVEVNNSFYTLTGYTREEVIGRTSFDIGIWANPDDRFRILTMLKEKGRIIDEEIQFREKSGRIHTMLFYAEIVMLSKVSYLLTINVDISERKKAEETILQQKEELETINKELKLTIGKMEEANTELLKAQQKQLVTHQLLQQSEEKFSKAFHLGPIIITISTLADGRYLEASDYFIRLTEYTRDEVIGHTSQELGIWVNSEDRNRVTRILTGGGSVIDQEVLFQSRSGKIYNMLFSAEIVLINGEEHLVSMAVDLTERRRAEEALRESEEQYTRLVNTIPDFIVRTNLDGMILFVNDYALHISSYSREEIEGKNMLMFIAPEDRDRVIQNTLLMMERSLGPQEYQLIMKDGRKMPFEVNGDILRNEDGKPFGRVHVCRDITQRKESEQEKDQLQVQLIQAQKMESVGRLAGGVAHDFNNMLSVIIGNTEMAMDKVDPSEPIHKALQDILIAGQRSADLTRQLLAFARKQTVSPRVLNLNDTVTGMLKMLQRLIGEDINLAWMPGQKLWSVHIDPSQVDQLLANLMVNARDAIEKTGRITIETSNSICDEAYCSANPECIPGEYVILAVSDNGCGMDRETLGNIFEPFFTTKKEGQGTGLGLATVYGIVRQNSGFINVYSEPGKGTMFRIYLPRYLIESQESDDVQEQATIHGGTETVLIVEDEDTVLNLIKGMLEKLGYKVMAVRKTDEAIRQAGEYDGNIDLLLTDIVMPDMNGRELSERISAIKPGIKCLYMSGYTADVIAHHGILDEGVQFISKPFSLKALAEKIRETLEWKQ